MNKSGGYMNKKNLSVLIICMLLCGCSGKYSVAGEAASSAMGSGMVMLCTQQVKPGIELVLYRGADNDGYGCGLERKILGRWYWDGGSSGLKKITEDDREMTWSFQNFKNLILGTVPVVYGIVIDNRVTRVLVTFSGGKTVEAKVIRTESGTIVWYAAGKGVGKPKIIKGIAQNSQLLYYYPLKK